MIDRIFLCVLALSLQGAFLGLILLLLHPVTKKYLSKSWNYYLWLIVALRLIIPVQFSGGNLPGSLNSSGTEAEIQETLAQDEGREARTGEAEKRNRETADEDNFAPGVEAGETGGTGRKVLPGKEQNPDFFALYGKEVLTGAGILWLFGVLLIFSVKTVNYWRFTEFIMSGAKEITDERIIQMAEETKRALGIRSRAAVFESGKVKGPVTLFFFRHRIILPQEKMGEEELSLVLRHELMHLKRKDLWYKWLFQAVLCVHWFNPILYLAAGQLNTDCELSCDEKVLKGITDEERRTYGNVLIDTAQKQVEFKRNVFSTTLLERKEDLKERLNGIIKYKGQNKIKTLLSAVLFGGIFLLSACGLPAAGGYMPFGFSYDEMEDSEDDGWETEALEVAREDYTLFDWVNLFSGNGADAWLKGDKYDVDKRGDAYLSYDSDERMAGEDNNDHWSAYCYSGGKDLNCEGLSLNGTDSLLIAVVNEETEIEVNSSFILKNGRFKIVHVGPDGSVTTINDSGKKNEKVVFPEGRNVIKMVGQEAKLEELSVRYRGVGGREFDKIYYSEEAEYSDQLVEQVKAGQTIDKEKLMEALVFLNDEDASQVFAELLKQGVSFNTEEMVEVFLYSNRSRSSDYLLEAVEDGTLKNLDAEFVTELMPYFKYGARGMLVKAVDPEKIAFEDLAEWIPYCNAEETEECILYYLDAGNILSYREFSELAPYLNQSTIDKIDQRLPGIEGIGN